MTVVEIALPSGYRAADVLAFHARDAEGVAERVEGNRIRKGIMVDGAPVLVDLTLETSIAHCTLDAAARDALPGLLGLCIDPAPFEEAMRDDPLLGPLITRTPGLRIVQSASVFEALTWAIIGQQINLPFAISSRRTLILQAGRQHSSGIWCYPEAADVAALAVEDLTTRKFSRAKAETLLRLAQLVVSGELSLAADAPLEDVKARLLAVKGIGPWTVNYALLRGYGYADCSLHGDVAVRAALQRLLGEDVKPTIARTEALLAHYAPYRTMAAAYLWASLAQDAAAIAQG